MIIVLCVLGLLLDNPCTAFSFVPCERQYIHRSSLLRRYYTENNDHLVWQKPALSWLEDEDSWKEWHFSFSQNGFTDFLPPFSENLNCLLVGPDNDNDNNQASRLPWEEEPQSQITTAKKLLKQDYEKKKRIFSRMTPNHNFWILQKWFQCTQSSRITIAS